MSAQVSLNLLNELRKSDKMRGLSSILSRFFAMSLINIYYAEARMLDIIYHMTLKLRAQWLSGRVLTWDRGGGGGGGGGACLSVTALGFEQDIYLNLVLVQK